MELKPGKINIQDDQFKSKDINKSKKIENENIFEKSRQYSSENKNIEKNEILSDRSKEPVQKILTKSKTEKNYYAFNIKNKRDDSISKLEEPKVNIITKEIDITDIIIKKIKNI